MEGSGRVYKMDRPTLRTMAAGAQAQRFRFNVCNSISWAKHDGSGAGTGGHSKVCKEQLRAYFPQTERIIFAEHYGADNMAKGEAGYAAKCDELRGFVFEPLRAYLDDEREQAGISYEDVRQAVGCAPGSGLPSHWFSRSQWALPTRGHYEVLQRLFNAKGNAAGAQHLRRDYEDLRRDYEDLRRDYEDLRRPFNVSARVHHTDVWNFATVQAYKGKHPCEKPLAMMEHIISASSRPGAVVLDCFAGSGATLEAAAKLGRSAIGIEKSEHWINYAGARVARATREQEQDMLAVAGVGL
ncbi:hypothetical protein LCGC14_1736750 [marine sediment metagenome]|uniref:DNA methylase N-4/N-6 domain-containing protein n=1 Tax=marine sediment metagenome TaxID=412755 RepID=A0A0F9JN91_9ZZZZ